MFPLNGNLIDGKLAYLWLTNNAPNVSGCTSICSAFLRSSIINDISPHFQLDSSVRVMARWQLGDLLAGASDLEAYKVCRRHGWKFYVCLNFHGKVFHLPPHGILVGSANATESGLGLLSSSNSEACTIVDENKSNINFITELFHHAYEVNDELFARMLSIVNQAQEGNTFIEWPDSITNILITSISYSGKLFLSECFKTNGEELLSCSSVLSLDAKLDLSLLGLSEHHLSKVSIALQFKKTKIYFLLVSLLEKCGGELYFGTLTSAMHVWLIEDPAPYRREVKVLTKNLYSWISALDKNITLLSVDRPNHSERISLDRKY